MPLLGKLLEGEMGLRPYYLVHISIIGESYGIR